MVDVCLTPDSLHLEVKGSHRYWALRSSLDVPLQHVVRVYADPKPAMGWFQGLKLVGADIPNIFRAGLFLQDGNRVFWDVRHPKKTIVIELEDEGFAKLIVEVKDPAAAVEEITRALEKYREECEIARIELEQSLKDPFAHLGESAPSPEDVRVRLKLDAKHL